MDFKRKVYIITLNGYFNFGNRLQNYALVKVLENMGLDAETYWKKKLIEKIKEKIKLMLFIPRYRRMSKFYKFSKKYINENNKIESADVVLIGSDQVWNPLDARKNMKLLGYGLSKKIVSYAASFGVSEIPKDLINYYKNGLKNLSKISVREIQGVKILNTIFDNKINYDVNIDPTLLLTNNQWDNISKKPKQIYKLNKKNYILNYFLGELSENRREEIKKIAKENNCEIINILDKNDPFYLIGPSEFLWLEKHAFLICTDSFHSSVFAILYNRPFVVFKREEKNVESMNSRIETLISKFKLVNREYNGSSITKENLNHDYSEAYKILDKERKKSNLFLKNALNIEE